ncbi:tetratricopeptide repeat protein [Micromonospora echinospora]|uniref:tetratricopeptide repeat protein n=1 Tax=Micromonospora echinospora TaxID=1877 RepID=UPI003A8B5677
MTADEQVPIEIRTANAGRDLYVARTQHFGLTDYVLDRFVPLQDADVDWTDRPPSELLAGQNEVVDFVGRERELAELVRWRDAAGTGLHLVHGAGGQGKTRLARQFATRSVADGWTVLVAQHPGAARPPILGKAAARTLLIVDYADRWPRTTLERVLCRDPGPALGAELKVLLLARTAGPWWLAVRYALRRAGYRLGEQALAPLGGTEEQRQQVYAAAVRRFREAYRLPEESEPEPPGPLGDPSYRSVLTLQMSALVAVDAAARGETPPAAPGALSDYLLDREYAHWAALHDGGHVEAGPQVMGRLVSVATLTRPVPRPRAARTLTLVRLADSPRAAESLLDDHQRSYPPTRPDTALEPLYPDRLGEDFIARQLPASGGGGDPWCADLPRRLLAEDVDGTGAAASGGESPGADGPAATYRHVAWTVLTETGRRWPHVFENYVYPLLAAEPAMILGMGGTALAVVAECAPVAVLQAIEPALPKQRHVDLDPAVAVILRRLTEHHVERTADIREHYHWYSRLSERLAYAGRHDDALAAAEKVVERLRSLNRGGFDPYPELLAAALVNLGFRLTGVGRDGDALAATRESVAILRALPQIGRDRGSQLGVALNNLAVDLNHTGRSDDAFTVIEEAVRILEPLAARSSADHRARYAMALGTRGATLLNLNRPQDALSSLTESARLYRSLTGTSPDTYSPDLAKALHDVGEAQAAVQDWTAAEESVAEALQIRRRLAQVNEDAYALDFASSAVLAARIRIATGRPVEAAALLAESSGPHERLLTLPDQEPRQLGDVPRGVRSRAARLASFLLTYSEVLTDLERHEDALAASRRAVDIYRKLVADAGNAYRGPLIVALNSLAVDLTRLGQREAGRATVAEAVTLAREVAVGGPPTARFNLAMVLHGSAIGLMQADTLPEALGTLDEAIAIWAELAADGHAEHIARLAASMSVRGMLLAGLGRLDEAVPGLERAVALYRQLDERHLAMHARYFGTTLRTLSGLRFAAGEPEAALAHADLAVALYEDVARRAGALDSLSVAYLEQARILAVLGRDAEAHAADEAALAHERSRNDPCERRGEEVGELAAKAHLFNERGYLHLQAGRLPLALDLLGLARDCYRRCGDGAGEILAMENICFVHRAARRYPEAAGIVQQILERSAAWGFDDKVRQYLLEILIACRNLEEFGGNPIVVREPDPGEDLSRIVAERGEDVQRDREVLVVSPEQTILEIVGNLTAAERHRFLSAVEEWLLGEGHAT